MNVMVVVQRQPDLLQIVLALRSPGGFACLLYRRQQKSDQNRNNCDHHQQLNQRKCTTMQSHNDFPLNQKGNE